MRWVLKRLARVAVYLAVPVWLPLLLIACVTQVVFLPGELRLRHAMRRANRWSSARSFAKAGPDGGTIIIEQVTFNYNYRRVWWTPDDLAAAAPVPPPRAGDDGFDGPDHYRWHPYDRWLTEAYLRPRSGSATLLCIWDRRSVATLRDHFRRYPSVVCFSGGEALEAFTSGEAAQPRLV